MYARTSESTSDIDKNNTKYNPLMNSKLYLIALAALTFTACGSDEEEAFKPQKVTNDGSVAVLACPDENHPHAINLGLPSGTKWSCCNVGATTPESFGGYYAWGETTPKTNFTWGTYVHYDTSDPYNIQYHNLGEDIAGTQHDAAHSQWGGHWQMPTYAQFQELMDNCQRMPITKTLSDGTQVKGTQVTGPNKATIFLPSASYYTDKGLISTAGQACFWTSNPAPADQLQPDFAIRFSATTQKFEVGSFYRFYGLSIRPIAK